MSVQCFIFLVFSGSRARENVMVPLVFITMGQPAPEGPSPSLTQPPDLELSERGGGTMGQTKSKINKRDILFVSDFHSQGFE